MKAFKVERSRFYFQKEDYGNDQPILDISVENGTDKAVARVFFKGVIASPEEASLGSLTSSTIKFLEVWNCVRKPTGN